MKLFMENNLVLPIYLTSTRSCITYSTSLLSRSMNNRSCIYLGVGKRVLRYIQALMNYGVRLLKPWKQNLCEWEGGGADHNVKEAKFVAQSSALTKNVSAPSST